MKKIFIIISSMFFPIIAFAEKVTFSINPTNETDAVKFIEKLGNWLFTFALAAVPIAIMVGGFMFVSAAGNPEKIKLGKQIILWAIIGLTIVMMAKGIILIVQGVLGV